jgi:hypothetical protein
MAFRGLSILSAGVLASMFMTLAQMRQVGLETRKVPFSQAWTQVHRRHGQGLLKPTSSRLSTPFFFEAFHLRPLLGSKRPRTTVQIISH